MEIKSHRNKPNNPSFGWNIKTHSLLTKYALNEIPELNKYQSALRIGSQMPDIFIKQTSVFGDMAHSFLGKNFITYDIAPQNASDFYFDNLGKSFMHLNNNCRRLGMFRAGNALHFLQDMAVPMHTKRECHSVLQMPLHIRYESIAKNNPQIIENIASKTKLSEGDNFYKFFVEAYKKSSKMPNPYEKRQDKLWEASVTEALESAYISTYKFLKRLAQYTNASNKERIQNFDDTKVLLKLSDNFTS